MKQNEFYEVDGCTYFIPVTINETYADSIAVTVDNYFQGYKLVVKNAYRFPKVHEQQKPVVPKFVAEWIERHKAGKKKDRLSQALGQVFDYSVELGLYIKQQEGDYTETIAKAWLDGYEVEKEKLYTAEIPNPNNEYSMNVLIRLPSSGKIALVALHKPDTSYLKNKEYQLTEAEIKQDFEWAFQFAKPVEEN